MIFHLSNQSNCKFTNITNFKRIQFLISWLQPVVGVESNEFELIFIKFFQHFLPLWINRIANCRIERILNKFQFDFTPSLTYRVPKFSKVLNIPVQCTWLYNNKKTLNVVRHEIDKSLGNVFCMYICWMFLRFIDLIWDIFFAIK